jgi:argininosuccinate synthase
VKQKVALAFSGGLDTSFCVKYLSLEKDLEVHSVFIKNHHYPMSVSSERIFQAMAVVEYAQKQDINIVAHGSTGAGNDQVRFDMIFQILAPGIEVLAPIRELKLSREAEVEYLQKVGFNESFEKHAYSINQGLWGTTVGGKETLTSGQGLPEEAYPSQLKDEKPRNLTVEFDKGEIVGGVETIRLIQGEAADLAIGRGIHMGETIIGIKGRVGFEAAAPAIIIRAHQELEKHTLGKWQAYWKGQLSEWYGMMLHEGQYLDPVMRKASGATYGEMHEGWSGDDVIGFTRIMSNPARLYHSLHPYKS